MGIPHGIWNDSKIKTEFSQTDRENTTDEDRTDFNENIYGN